MPSIKNKKNFSLSPNKRVGLLIGCLLIISIIGISIYSLVISSNQKNSPTTSPPKETTNTQEEVHTADTLQFQKGKFTLENGQLVFRATIKNMGPEVFEKRMATLQILGENKKILTQQAIFLPTIKPNISLDGNWQFEDIVEGIVDYKIIIE